MFWIELYLICQLASWFVFRLALNLPAYERHALSIFLALGIKSALMFFYLILGLTKFNISPPLFTAIIFLSYLFWMRTSPLKAIEFPAEQLEKVKLHEYFGFWVLVILFILSLANAWTFPITVAVGIWHHLKGMVYGQVFADFESKQIIS